MRKGFSCFLLNSLLLLLLVSCQKEVNFQDDDNNGSGSGSGGNTQEIIGDYNFLGIGGNTSTTVTVSSFGQELKAVTNGGYISENNVGTAKITASQFIFAGIGYDIDTVIHVTTYLNGSVFDDSDQPYITAVPPSNDTMNYVRNNADSITLTGGDIIPTGSTSIDPGPIGARIAWSGDTLLLKINTTVDTTITQSGIPGRLNGKLTGVIKLKKRQ